MRSLLLRLYVTGSCAVDEGLLGGSFRGEFVTFSKTYMKLVWLSGTLTIAEALTSVDEFCGSTDPSSQRGHIPVSRARGSAF